MTYIFGRLSWEFPEAFDGGGPTGWILEFLEHFRPERRILDP
jgi:hypothetical protein